MGGDKLLDSGSERAGLFLSYHSSEYETVARISRFLEANGISTFLDRKDLAVGLPWPEALEQALTETRAVVVFLGGEGLGAWQKREVWFALDRQSQAEKAGASFPVIPVLLPGTDPSTGFLFLNTWVDLRDDPTDPEELERLARAVRSVAPARPQEALPLFCPYRGLQPFGEEDAAFFCGREAFSERLFEAVLRNSFVAVTGPSGSGKSSLVHAGLLPRLRQQRPPAVAWDAVSFTPGERPFHRLSAALLPLLEPGTSEVEWLEEAERLGNALAGRSVRLEEALRRVLEGSKGTGRLLLIADQFDELFTLTGETFQRSFAETLLEVTEKLPTVSVVLTLRADFYEQALTLSRKLSDRLEEALVNLGPMHKEELVEAVQRPALRLGLEFEPGLVDRILDEVEGEPGNLPLLEFALTELWGHRSGRRLTNDAFMAIGGVAGAIVQRAESELEKLTPEQRKAARRVFTALVRVASSDEGSRDTRRRVKLEDFDEVSRQVVDRLAGPETRLLVTGRDEKGEGVVEVAHEALIQSWKRLQQWLGEDREFLLWRERLRTYLAERERSGAVLSSAPLTEAEAWLGKRRKDLAPEEVAFIEGSAGVRDARFATQARRRRRLILGGLGTAGLITVLGVIVGWLGLQTMQHVEELRASLILAVQETVHDPADLALLALELDKVAAPQIKGSLDATRFAHRAAKSMLPVAILRGHEDLVLSAVFSPDGSHVLTTSVDGTARIWNVDGSGEPLVFQNPGGVFVDATFSPDGSRILSRNWDGPAFIWNADGSGKPLVLRGVEGSVADAAFSPDSSRALVASDRIVQIWERESRAGPIVLRGHEGLVYSAAFSPDGSRVVSASEDGTARIWNADGSGAPVVLRGHENQVVSASFSPDGSRVVTASHDGTVRVWSVDDSRSPIILRDPKSLLDSAVFSPDGSLVLTTSDMGDPQIWNADGTGEPVALPGDEDDGVWQVGFSPDGTHVLTTYADGTARVWNTAGEEICVLRGHESAVKAAAFSPDGSLVVTASDDRTARVWRIRPTEPVVLQGDGYMAAGAAFSPDGTRIAVAYGDSIARVWRADGAGKPRVLRGHEGAVTDVAFSPDGSLIITASDDKTARIWKTDGTGGPLAILRGHNKTVWSATFSPDGSRVLTRSQDGTARVWHVDGTGNPAVLRNAESRMANAAFSPDGSWILTTFDDDTMRVWNADGSYLQAVFKIDRDAWVSFSPDGSRFLTIAGENDPVRIWKADGSGEPVVIDERFVQVAAFSPDGTRVVIAAEGGSVRVWNTDGTGMPTTLRDYDESELSFIDATFSPDGSRVLAVSDFAIWLWNADGRGVPLVIENDGRLFNPAFSPDASRVLAFWSDGTGHVWSVGWSALIDSLKSSVHACLAPEKRIKYLRETASAADAAYERCQRNLRKRRATKLWD